jgi:hypothetical protein
MTEGGGDTEKSMLLQFLDWIGGVPLTLRPLLPLSWQRMLERRSVLTLAADAVIPRISAWR